MEIESNKQLTFDQKYDKILDQISGRFTWFVISGFFCGMLCQTWFMYGLTYYELMPTDFLCKKDEIWVKCARDDFCTASQPIQWKIDYSTNKALHNYVEKLNLTCASKITVGLIGSSFFFGWAFSLLWVPRLADIYGRQMIYRIALIVTIALFVGEYACSNVNLMIVLNFLIGVTMTCRMSVGYVYMMEYVKLAMQPKLCTVWGVCDAMVYLIITIYFTQISKYWHYITYIGVVQVLWATFVAFLTPESPKFLLN